MTFRETVTCNIDRSVKGTGGKWISSCDARDGSILMGMVLYSPAYDLLRELHGHELMVSSVASPFHRDVIVVEPEAASESFPAQMGSRMLASVWFAHAMRPLPLAPLNSYEVDSAWNRWHEFLGEQRVPLRGVRALLVRWEIGVLRPFEPNSLLPIPCLDLEWPLPASPSPSPSPLPFIPLQIFLSPIPETDPRLSFGPLAFHLFQDLFSQRMPFLTNGNFIAISIFFRFESHAPASSYPVVLRLFFRLSW